MAIRLLITDFDGTLVDTFEANYLAYKEAFRDCHLFLTREQYRRCFGLRFDRFMEEMGVSDPKLREAIRESKGRYYPNNFDKLRVNRPLLNFIRAFRRSGGLTAVASTARQKNLLNALRHIGAVEDFDLILAGEDVRNGKPDPEIYRTVINRLGVKPEEALIFEDSAVGFRAAENAGIQYMVINPDFYDNGN